MKARAPWLLDGSCNGSGGPQSGETWLTLLQFSELADAAQLPSLTAAEDVTAVVAPDGELYTWGAVVDTGSGVRGGGGGGHTRVLVAAAGYAFNAAAGITKAPLIIRRNIVGVGGITGDAGTGTGGSGRRGRPPTSPAVSAASTSSPSGGGAVSRFNYGSPAQGGWGGSPGAGTAMGSVDPMLMRLMHPPKAGAFKGERVLSIAIGRLHVVAATDRGSVFTWGGDAAGQLGHGAIRESVALARLALGGSPSGGSSGTQRRRRRSGSRGSGGAGGGYESPQGGTSPRCGSPRGGGSPYATAAAVAEQAQQWSRPRQVRELVGQRVVAVAAARYSTAALTAGGTLFTWGDNRHGILGLGDDLDRDLPARVASFGGDWGTLGDGAGYDGKGASHRRFLKGISDTESSDDDFHGHGHGRGHGSDWHTHIHDGWGNRKRDLGRGDQSPRANGKVVKIAFGARHAVAVTANGTAHTWGSNVSGQLGLEEGPSNAPFPWPMPMEIGGTVEGHNSDQDEDYEQGNLVQLFNDVTRERDVESFDHEVRIVGAAAGVQHTVLCGACGRVWVVGSGYGVGLETMEAWTAHSRVRGLPPVVDVAAGAAHSAAITGRGDVWTWGDNTYGQLGPLRTKVGAGDGATGTEIGGGFDEGDRGGGEEASLPFVSYRPVKMASFRRTSR